MDSAGWVILLFIFGFFAFVIYIVRKDSSTEDDPPMPSPPSPAPKPPEPTPPKEKEQKFFQFMSIPRCRLSKDAPTATEKIRLVRKSVVYAVMISIVDWRK